LLKLPIFKENFSEKFLNTLTQKIREETLAPDSNIFEVLYLFQKIINKS